MSRSAILANPGGRPPGARGSNPTRGAPPMSWNPFKGLARRPGRRPSPARGLLSLLELESRVVPANVTTYHNDVASTGVNASETVLTRTNVNPTSFGKLFQVQVQ